jgi:methionyl-tRNA formyltransferase
MVDDEQPVLRLAYFGTPEFAVPSLAALLKSRHQLVGAVTQPDRPRGRGQHVTDCPVKRLAVEHGIPVLQPERLKDPAFIDGFRAWAPDLGVVAAYGRILPESVLAIPRLGLVNVHASLLPRYRGAAPVHRAVMAGETETGVSIMHLVQELDAGAVYAAANTPIEPDETSIAVEERLAHLGAGLLVHVVDQLAAGRAVAVPQEDESVSYASRLRKDEGLIDWRADAIAIHNQVRGLQPWPMAWTFLAGQRLIIVQTRVREGAGHSSPRAGEVVDVSADAVSVCAGDGATIDLLTVQPEGRRAMSIRDFMAGHPVKPGAGFGTPAGTPVPL